MITRIILPLAIFFISLSSAFCQVETKDSDYKKHSIGSSFFMLGNFASYEAPSYYQLNYGYRVTPKDVVSIEAITWEYHEPLGTSLAKKQDDIHNFPGKVKAYGIGLVYKRFLWKGAYSAIHSSAMHQNYLDIDEKKIQSGFQLFTTMRFGYHFKLFKNRAFIEPSFAFTYWPINTNLPDSFQVEEDKWNNYFLFEPGLHFGINF